MKIILLKDVRGIGQRDTVLDVSDGHALNLLIPQGLAVQATPDRVAALEVKKKASAETSAQLEQQYAAAAKKIDGARIEIAAKANAQEHLYKQLTEAQVAAAAAKQFSVSIEASMIGLSSPIKTLGEFPIEITMGKSRASCTLVVASA